MIKNYKLFKESLLNKMTGYSEEDIKNNFLNGEIEYRKYLELCDENGWEKPSYNVAYKLFKDDKINALDFFSECKNNDWKIPSDEELFKSLKANTPREMLYYSSKLKNFNAMKKAIEMGADTTGYIFDFLTRTELFDGVNDIKEDDLNMVKYLLNRHEIPYSEEVLSLIRNCFPENKILIEIINLFLQEFHIRNMLKNYFDVEDLIYWCESNKNKELLNIILKYFDVKDYKKPKGIWYERIFKSNESLLNKLEGPSKDEVKSNLRELLNDKKISFEKYIKLCKEYGIEQPPTDEKDIYFYRTSDLSNPEQMFKKALEIGYFGGILKALEKNEKEKRYGNTNTINFYYIDFRYLYLFNEEEQKFIIELIVKNLTPSYLLDRGIFYNSYPVVKYALEFDKGEVLNNTYSPNPTPFFESAENCDLDIIKLLLEYTDDKYKNTIKIPNNILENIVVKKDIETLKVFIKNNIFSPNNKWKNWYDEKILRYAIINNVYDIVKLLIDNGVDIHVRGEYALGTACMEGHIDIVKLLVKHGANVHGDYSSDSEIRDEYPVGVSLYNNDYELAKYLIDQGADPNNASHTFINKALKEGTPKIKELLKKTLNGL